MGYAIVCWVFARGVQILALTLQRPAHVVGISMWLALIMAFNV